MSKYLIELIVIIPSIIRPASRTIAIIYLCCRVRQLQFLRLDLAARRHQVNRHCSRVPHLCVIGAPIGADLAKCSEIHCAVCCEAIDIYLPTLQGARDI